MTEVATSSVSLLRADVEQLTALPQNALISAAGGIDALGRVLGVPEGFVPSDINGWRANDVTSLLPHIESAFDLRPDDSPDDGGQLIRDPIPAIQALLPDWYEEVARDTPRRWLHWLLGNEGKVNNEAARRFPEFAKSEVGALALREALAPLVTVANLAEQYPTLVSEASEAIDIIQERAQQRHRENYGEAAAAHVTDRDIAFEVTSLWVDLLAQNSRTTEHLPALSDIVRSRLEQLGVRPDQLSNSNITVPTPDKITPYMPEFLQACDEVLLPDTVDRQLLKNVFRQRKVAGIFTALARLSTAHDWLWAAKGTMLGLRHLWESGWSGSNPAPAHLNRLQRWTKAVQAATLRQRAALREDLEAGEN